MHSGAATSPMPAPALASAGTRSVVESLVPIAHDPNTEAGRQALNLFDLDGASIEPFRLLPGDDASCLNLYEPTSPRILAPRDSFLAAGRFTFQSSLAATDAERENPGSCSTAQKRTALCRSSPTQTR
jgi:hypothetical protein